jgi:hypothetical protein
LLGQKSCPCTGLDCVLKEVAWWTTELRCEARRIEPTHGPQGEEHGLAPRGAFVEDLWGGRSGQLA